MGFLDRLFGSDDAAREAQPVSQNSAAQAGGAPSTQPPRSEDEIAIERYRYLLRTAPPETIEEVHAEAFGRLTEAQRKQVLADLSAGLPASEQPRASDPQSMARAATRAESSDPGFMERTFGGGQRGGGPSFGSMVGGSLLGTIAGYVIGSAIVSSLMAPAFAVDPGAGDGSGDGGSDAGGVGSDAGADGPGADASGDAGGWGGDVGGGDFGGFGDVGGGDFGGF